MTITMITDAWGVELARMGATVDPFLVFGPLGYWRDMASRLYMRRRYLLPMDAMWASREVASLDVV